jgi:hypothetical protein
MIAHKLQEVLMAVVTDFERVPKERLGVHPTSTVCEYIEFETHGQMFLQLSTGGSAERQNPGKVSQTLQLNAHAARRLHDILETTFPELGR